MRIAIVEDEAASAELLIKYLEKYAREEKTDVFETTVFSDGDEFLKNYKPVYDIVFMDIEMPKIDGMSAAKHLRTVDNGVCLVFVTNMAQYAIKGYEVAASDFIVKPVRYTDFVYRLKKMSAVVEARQDRELTLRFGSEMRRVRVSDVYYVSVDNHNVIYHTHYGDIKVSESLAQAEKNLEKFGFAKCNSGYLVNLNYVKELKGNEVNVTGHRLIISRPKKKEFTDRVAIYFGGGV